MFELVYGPENPCGCGSNKTFGACCLKNGHVVINPKNCHPTPPITRNRHKKCLLGWTNDCCNEISGDHFISAAVLRVINSERITVSSAGFTREHSIKSSALTVKRLCRRHNSALSPIDSEAARMFRNFARINDELNRNAAGQKLCFFNGADIERWLVKTLLMVFFAKQTRVNPEHFRIPVHATSLLQFDLGRPLGLYIPTETVEGRALFQVEPAATISLITKANLVCGVTATLGGLPLTLIIDGAYADFERLLTTHTYRPKSFLFFKGQEVYCMGFAFNDGSEQDLWLSHGDPTASIPSN